VRQFLDVVHQAEELPLPVNLLRPRSVKRFSRLLWRRLPNTGSTVQSARRKVPPAFRVDGLFHPLGDTHRRRVGLAAKETHLPRLRLLRRTQTFRALVARHAIPQRPLELHGEVAVVLAVRAVLVERLPRRADAGAGFGVVVEIPGAVVPGPFLRMCLVVERIGQLLVFALLLEAFVPFAHAVVGDQGGISCSARASRLASEW